MEEVILSAVAALSSANEMWDVTGRSGIGAERLVIGWGKDWKGGKRDERGGIRRNFLLAGQ